MAGTEGLVLQDRDRRLLTALGTMRVVDRDQAMGIAGFHSITRANTRLLRLKNAGLLHRLFVGSRAGNRKALYVLSPKGAAIAGVHTWHMRRQRHDRLIVDPFIEHQLTVNALCILVCHRPMPGVAVQVKNWTVFPEPLSVSAPLSPDGYFELQSADIINPMFLEVDQGTEGQKVWKKKTESYLRFAVTGEFANRFGQSQFRVLVVANSERRLQSIRATILRHTDKIFWFTTFEIINREGFWSSIWVRPKDDRRQSLLGDPSCNIASTAAGLPLDNRTSAHSAAELMT